MRSNVRYVLLVFDDFAFKRRHRSSVFMIISCFPKVEMIILSGWTKAEK